MASWVYIYALVSTGLLAILANFIVKVVPKKGEHLNRILGCFMALAAGALIGDALIYLLPKAVHDGWTTSVTVSIVAGVVLMFLLEQTITWRELKYKVRMSRRNHAAVSNMFGFSTQSFVDGLVIASSYVAGLQIGIATTIAVVIHQIPQEISNYVILRRAGVGNLLANRINVLAVFMSFVGAGVSLLLPVLFKVSLTLAAPFTAGVFLYVALAELTPDLIRERSLSMTIYQTVLFLVGISLIVLVKYFKAIIGALD
ncbi:MAG: ZIP family metal transporter [Patescibacteria group bacterium]